MNRCPTCGSGGAFPVPGISRIVELEQQLAAAEDKALSAKMDTDRIRHEWGVAKIAWEQQLAAAEARAAVARADDLQCKYDAAIENMRRLDLAERKLRDAESRAERLEAENALLRHEADCMAVEIGGVKCAECDRLSAIIAAKEGDTK
jgi:hypothetical protein